MRWLCRDISKEERAVLLSWIKEKFPNIDVLMDDGAIVGPGWLIKVQLSWYGTSAPFRR